ncbi:MAG: porin, partial [Rickettsiaceae bacterium]|nr:porin [Rickettsiaceae bacterium]
MLKRILPLILTLTFLSSNIFAAGPKLKLNGKIDFRFIKMHHNAELLPKNKVTNMQPNMGFDSTVNVIADASNKTDYGLTYGARVNLQTSARNNRSTASHIYLTTKDYGKIELGSDKTAAAKMKITSTSNAAATGGGWDAYVKSDPMNTKTEYIVSWAGFLDQKVRPGGKKNNAEYSRKITYYTPEFSGWQIGVSYIPDSDNRGYARPSSNDNTFSEEAKVHFVDALSMAVSYKKDINNDWGFRGAVAVEKASEVVPLSVTTPPRAAGAAAVTTKYKLSTLNNYTVGAEVKYQNLSLATSYGNYMKSCTNEEYDVNGRSTQIYGATVKYILDKKLSVSLGGFKSKHKGNDFSSATLAADYKIASGILPY